MATVTVHALSSGSLTASDHAFIFPSDPTSKRSVPSMSFLVQRQKAGKTERIVFDLGIRRDLDLYPTRLQQHCVGRQPMTTKPDVVESLAKGGLRPEQIDYVIFSHVHYDHIGLPSDFHDPNTKFVVGPGSLDLLSGKTVLEIGSHSVFEPDLLPLDRTIELPSIPTSTNTGSSIAPSPLAKELGLEQEWMPLDPFPHAIDLFRDQSIFILSAPGHLPGHIALLCRLSPEKYVALLGDACHDVRLLTGERDISTWTDAEGNWCCIHAEPAVSKETIRKFRKVQQEGISIDGKRAEVEIVFAHDWAWERDAVARNRFWPGKV